jgi:hypothetical protein
MKLVWETYKTEAGPIAEAAVEELCDRFRALSGGPVRLVVVQPERLGALEVVVICRSKAGLTWVWLAYDCLAEPRRIALRLKPYTMADARRDCFLADLLREHLS